MRWYIGHCSPVYEGKLMTIKESAIDENQADEVGIAMDCSLG